MQEIVSPFRNLGLSTHESPEKADDRWTINPIKVPRNVLDNHQKSFQAVIVHHEESEGDEMTSSYYGSAQRSQCLSPVKNP